MRPSISEGSRRDERRLFQLNSRLERARTELSVAEEQLAALEEIADEARVRALVSETPLAEQDFQRARRHAETHRASLETARLKVRELEKLQDDLIAKLIGG